MSYVSLKKSRLEGKKRLRS